MLWLLVQCQGCVGFGVLTVHQICRVSLSIGIFGVGLFTVRTYVALKSEVASTNCYVAFTSEGVVAE